VNQFDTAGFPDEDTAAHAAESPIVGEVARGGKSISPESKIKSKIRIRKRIRSRIKSKSRTCAGAVAGPTPNLALTPSLFFLVLPAAPVRHLPGRFLDRRAGAG
jgi:hypothetical protein